MTILPAYRNVWSRVISFSSLCDAVIQNREIHDILPEEIQRDYRYIKGKVLLTDFAGRDSIAACIKILNDENIGTIIPVGDIVPSRYGDSDSYSQNWDALAQLIEEKHPHVELKPWFIIDGQDFWKTMNERYVDQILERYGWFTPCIGCHFHFYAMRSVLVDLLGKENTILTSGEKRLHSNGKRKANQTDAAVEGYRRFSREHGVEHRFPIHDMDSEEDMKKLIGGKWKEGGSQMSCIHSGNDRDTDGQLKYTDEQISQMMNDYVLPMGKKYVELEIDMENQDYRLNILDEYSEELLRGTQ